MSGILSAIKTFIATYSGLETGAALTVDYTGETPVWYSINPQPGNRIVESYINGGSVREYPFSFQFTVATADEAERLETNEFSEDFAAWLESQTNAGTLPTLETGKTATAIEATSWGYLFEQGQSETGIYMILCKLTYDQEP